jgi:hypothetical protein
VKARVLQIALEEIQSAGDVSEGDQDAERNTGESLIHETAGALTGDLSPGIARR